MKSPLVLTFLIAAVVAPASAFAADQAPPASAPVLCHAVQSGESPNATMGQTQLACQPVDMTQSKIAFQSPQPPADVPKRTESTTPQQSDEEYNDDSLMPQFPGFYDINQY